MVFVVFVSFLLDVLLKKKKKKKISLLFFSLFFASSFSRCTNHAWVFFHFITNIHTHT